MALVALAAALGACHDDRDASVMGQVQGVAQKGPFDAGARFQAQVLDAGLQPLAAAADGSSQGVDGYRAPLRLRGPWLRVQVNGRFLDELDGAGDGPAIGLKALAAWDATTEAPRVNLNLLTTLAHDRTLALVAGGLPAPQAAAVAEAEVAQAFDLWTIAQPPAGFGSVDLTGDRPADAFALLLSLTLLQAGRDLGMAAQELLDALVADFSVDGALNNAAMAQALRAASDHLPLVQATQRLQAHYAAAGRNLQFSATVQLGNRAPRVRLADTPAVLVGQPLTLDASASRDPEGMPLDFLWRVQRLQNDGPFAGTPLESFELAGPVVSFVPGKSASYRVDLQVSDPWGASTTVQTQAVAHHTFTPHDDGTVSNDQTGLVWQRFSDGQLYTMAEATGRSFLGIPNENNGLSVCADLVLAGHGDWRVPRLSELESLRDMGQGPPRVDPAAFPDIQATGLIADAFSPNSRGLFVEFEQGMVLREPLTSRYPLHCVRP